MTIRTRSSTARQPSMAVEVNVIFATSSCYPDALAGAPSCLEKVSVLRQGNRSPNVLEEPSGQFREKVSLKRKRSIEEVSLGYASAVLLVRKLLPMRRTRLTAPLWMMLDFTGGCVPHCQKPLWSHGLHHKLVTMICRGIVMQEEWTELLGSCSCSCSNSGILALSDTWPPTVAKRVRS